uniref:Very long-chain fatty acid transport protein n=1 Tax=Corethrella appendiculata TaxID=1370023 RepID=U5ELJ8_9DIPT
MLLELNRKQKGLTFVCMTAVATLASLVIGRRLIPQTILSAIVFYLFTGDRPVFLYAIGRSFRRDFTAAVRFIQINLLLYKWERANKIVATIFDDVVAKNPHKTAFIMDDNQVTFEEVQNFTYKIAQFFHENTELRRGDTVALFMETRIEYAPIWIGLSRLGIITALINTNLRKEALRHSIIVANTKAIVVSSELFKAVQELYTEDENIRNLPIYVYRNVDESIEQKNGLVMDIHDLRLELDKITEINYNINNKDLGPKDKLVYIYTSGTTGMPKAAVITNIRFMFMGISSFLMLKIYEHDVIYNALPMYHTAGGMVGLGNVILCGATMLLRKKFSASNFWPDCIKHNCTVAQYIGEICRFVLMQSPKPTDTQHKVRMMFGNGLRPQIWPQFISRFNIGQMCEIYGSTEGNSNLANYEGVIGAIGFIPRVAKYVYPVTLIRCNEDTGEVLRDANGLCIRSNTGESGVIVGQIKHTQATLSFGGYADKKATEKKVLRDVIRKGDMYFNSGDILVMDLLGYCYFKDRTGDTYRWRGENVATSEVEAIISNIVGLNDCAVYGVDIPETEGKAGMAAIVDTSGKLDLESLSAGIKGSLPPYARPIFIRVLKELPMTATFKLKKRDLQLEGYDLSKITDSIYFLNNDGTYRRFTEKDYDDIKNGRARL